MRVAIVQESMDTARGGAETSTRELAAELAKLGVEVVIVCAAARAGQAPEGDAGVRYARLACPGYGRAGRTRRFVAAAERFCRNGRFDVVHAITPCGGAQLYQPRGGTLAETVRRSLAMAGSPFWQLVKSLERRLNWRQRFLLRVERELLETRPPPLVAALSDYVRRQVVHDFPHLPAESLRVVFNGVTIAPLSDDERRARRAALRAELGLSAARHAALFLAHNFKLKGLAELIRATASADGRRGDWVCLVVGRDRPGRYRRMAQRLGVAARVQFLGAAGDVRSLFAAADVLAHPTWYDPCSRVVLEALSVGLPVVTTRFNGAAEVLDETRQGRIIQRPDDIGQLAAALRACVDHGLARICRESAETVRPHLSMRRHAEDLLRLYPEAAARSGEE